MPETSTTHLSQADLMAIRDAVPGLDLLGIRSLNRAGYRIVRNEGARSGEIASSQGRDGFATDETRAR